MSMHSTAWSESELTFIKSLNITPLLVSFLSNFLKSQLHSLFNQLRFQPSTFVNSNPTSPPMRDLLTARYHLPMHVTPSTLAGSRIKLFYELVLVVIRKWFSQYHAGSILIYDPTRVKVRYLMDDACLLADSLSLETVGLLATPLILSLHRPSNDRR